MTMSSVSIHSPLQSEVLNSLATLSPPPTPIAKRGCHFFPAEGSLPVPMFFPKTASVLGSSYHQPSRRIFATRSTPPGDEDDNSIDAESIFLAAYPPPSLRLEQRRRTVNVTPPPLSPTQNQKSVLQIPDDSLKLMVPKLPVLLPETSKSRSGRLSFTLSKRSYPPAMMTSFTQSTRDRPQQKVERRHSFAAKSA